MSDKKSIKEIKELFKNSDDIYLEGLIDEYFLDERNSVKEIIKSALKRKEKLDIERKRIDNIKMLETSLYETGYKFVAGIDEVGRGPLCGPVVSAAVIMPKESKILYINDSKKLSRKKREELFEKIKKEACYIGIGVVDNERIDEINILNAAKESMIKAIDNLEVKPDYLIIDALSLDNNIKQESIIKADEKIYCVSAASIVAKCYRDSLMQKYAKEYPEYKWEKNMGYGTAEHMEAIEKLGLTPLHRKSFLKSKTGALSKKEGNEYERVVCNYLKRKGYEILSRNYTTKFGEIDIISKEGSTVVFVEVKGRRENSLVSGFEAVDKKKRECIRKSSEIYIEENSIRNLCRFDVIEIINASFAYRINHIENAF